MKGDGVRHVLPIRIFFIEFKTTPICRCELDADEIMGKHIPLERLDGFDVRPSNCFGMTRLFFVDKALAAESLGGY